MAATTPRYQTLIGTASLVVGPALMSVGDLFHPPESNEAAAQVAIIAQSGSRWYAAHLLLFVGLLLFVPGILALTQVATERRPALGYAARLLVLAAVGAFSGVFVFEMLLGRFISQSGDQAGAVVLYEAFQSPQVFLVLVPGLLAFFIGVGLAVVSLASAADPLRWPALILGLGVLLILAEIILAQVLLSQIGNILCLVAGIAFARLLLRSRGGASA